MLTLKSKDGLLNTMLEENSSSQNLLLLMFLYEECRTFYFSHRYCILYKYICRLWKSLECFFCVCMYVCVCINFRSIFLLYFYSEFYQKLDKYTKNNHDNPYKISFFHAKYFSWEDCNHLKPASCLLL